MADILTIEAVYTIPQGYIGVLRGFSYAPDITVEFSNSFLVDNPTTFVPVSATLKVNDFIIPDYSDLNLGQAVEAFIPIFAVGNSGNEFKLELIYDIDVAIEAVGGRGVGASQRTFNVNMQLYGNLLLSRGLPKEFEIATQQYSGRVKQ